jgi:hypothetical protein
MLQVRGLADVPTKDNQKVPPVSILCSYCAFLGIDYSLNHVYILPRRDRFYIDYFSRITALN